MSHSVQSTSPNVQYAVVTDYLRDLFLTWPAQ